MRAEELLRVAVTGMYCAKSRGRARHELFDARIHDEAMERLRQIDETRQRHERDNEGIEELEGAGLDDLMYLTWASGARFKVLRGESTMPLQYARYWYPSE